MVKDFSRRTLRDQQVETIVLPHFDQQSGHGTFFVTTRGSAERMLASLSSAFGALALFLAVIGLYGVMSFVVAQRRQESGVAWRWARQARRRCG